MIDFRLTSSGSKSGGNSDRNGSSTGEEEEEEEEEMDVLRDFRFDFLMVVVDKVGVVGEGGGVWRIPVVSSFSHTCT